MHSSPTETVRLPPDGDIEQITVHPGVRSKLPLKRKVRNGKVRRKRKTIDPGTAAGTTTTTATTSPGKNTKSSPKKKKRVSAAVGAEETNKKPVETQMLDKIKKPQQHTVNNNNNNNKKKKKKKEIIDYSKAQTGDDGKKGLIGGEVIHTQLTPDSDPVGKVQNWLLKSHYALPKSKSTPVGLMDKSRRSPHKRPTIRPRTDKNKSHSIGNIPNEKDKVRLQVVYKPPFKFSVKLRKPDKTNNCVIVEKCVNNTSELKKIEKKPRTGVLVRSISKEQQQIDNNKKSTQQQQPQTNSNQTTTHNCDSVQQQVNNNVDNIDSNVHTVQSDLEVLLSESEFLFSDD